MGQGAAFERALTTSILQCLVKDGVGEGAGADQAAPALLCPMCSCPVMEFPHSHSKSLFQIPGVKLVWPVCAGFPDLTQQISHEFCLSGNPGASVSACGSCQVPSWMSGLRI